MHEPRDRRGRRHGLATLTGSAQHWSQQSRCISRLFYCEKKARLVRRAESISEETWRRRFGL
ncbi:hypothetical protein D7S89_22605 [Trinickia fusca]|uniref:Uncharacterized protein n=1 Tax=Trinickia fusca TaxID=2419777 RepID=A0A494X9R7_9BURK|nr:hypothetical protein D7S89_22605 [Trinickia fusca]